MRIRSINNPPRLAVLHMVILMLLALSASNVRSFATEKKDSVLSVLFLDGKAMEMNK